jgi:hypothetical protein
MAKTKNLSENDSESTNPAKGKPRPQAAVDVIDYADVADDTELEAVAGIRVSKWTRLLDNLYDDTVADNSPVPRDEDGNLKFVRLGTFNNAGGARTQVKAFEAKGMDLTYDFKTVVKGSQSFLWARVKFLSDNEG